MIWVSAIRTVGQGPNSPLTITNSPAAAKGDVLYAFIDSLIAPAGPSGWTQLAASGRLTLWRKVADVGEPTSYAWTETLGFSITGGNLYQVTGADNVQPEDIAASTSSGTDVSSFLKSSVTTVTDRCLLVVQWIVAMNQPLKVDASLAQDTDINNTRELASGSAVKQVAGATGGLTATTTPPLGSPAQFDVILVAVRAALDQPAIYAGFNAWPQPYGD